MVHSLRSCHHLTAFLAGIDWIDWVNIVGGCVLKLGEVIFLFSGWNWVAFKLRINLDTVYIYIWYRMINQETLWLISFCCFHASIHVINQWYSQGLSPSTEVSLPLNFRSAFLQVLESLRAACGRHWLEDSGSRGKDWWKFDEALLLQGGLAFGKQPDSWCT